MRDLLQRLARLHRISLLLSTGLHAVLRKDFGDKPALPLLPKVVDAPTSAAGAAETGAAQLRRQPFPLRHLRGVLVLLSPGGHGCGLSIWPMNAECGICFNAAFNYAALACCSQKVCRQCYAKILLTNPRCPYCQTALPMPPDRTHFAVHVLALLCLLYVTTAIVCLQICI